MKEENSERIGESCEVIAKIEKAKLLIKGIYQYNSLDGTAKQAGRHSNKSVVICLRIGNNKMVEWSGRKGEIVCIIYPRAMEGKPLRSQMNFIKSSVHWIW